MATRARAKEVRLKHAHTLRLFLALRLLLVRPRGLLPRVRHLAQAGEKRGNFGNRHAHLVARIALANRHGGVGDGMVIDGDGEWNAEFVGARVTLADGNGGGVELGADAVGRERLVHFNGDFVELVVVDEREDGGLDRGDDRGELEHSLLFVIRTNVEGVLEHAVHDATDTKGWFDDGGRVVATVDHLRLLFDGEHALFECLLTDGGLKGGRAVCFGSGLECKCIRFAEREKSVGDRLGILLESLADHLLVRRDDDNFLLNRLVEAFVRHEINLRLVRVRLEIKRGSIGETDAFNPTVRALNLGIPAVGGVVRHFMLQVLTETKASRIDTDLEKEQVASRDKITERFVGDDTLGNGFADSHRERLLDFGQLRVLAKEVELRVGNFDKARVLLVIRVHKVLNFRLRKLANAQETSARRNLVTKTLTDLRRGERKLTAVEVEQVSKVDKDALGGFRTKVTLEGAGRTDLRREHEVERIRLAQFVTSSGRLGFRVLQSIGHLLYLELVDARLHVFKLASAIGAEHRIGEQFFEAIFEQVIGAVALLGFDVVHHQVGKLFDVAVKMEKNKQVRFSSVYKSAAT